MRPDTPSVDPASPINPPEIVQVDTHRVFCDGPEGEGLAALGHPRVYMEMGAGGFVECGYCDRRFVLNHPESHGPDENQRLDPADYEGAAGN